MKKYLIFLYSVIGYISSLVTLTFLILWIYPWEFMPFYIDKPMVHLNANPVLIDVGLLFLFALQHSVMARSFFKEGLLKDIPEAVKAATYSVASSVCLALIFYFWQPIDGYAWHFQNDILVWGMTALYMMGWLLAFVSTFIIDHFELFGLHQGYRVLRDIPEPEEKFQVNSFYRYVRHPIQAGTFIGLLATPSMSYTHLLLSIGMGIYILIGLHYEEKSLLKRFGLEYAEYMKNTPMLIPFIK